MAKLHDALERAIEAMMGDRATLTTTAADLRRWLLRNEDIRAPVGDVEEAVRAMHQAGRIRLYAEGGNDQLDIELSRAPRHVDGGPTMNIHVSGGHVQVGDHNKQSITYGHILQSLTEVIERASNIPDKDKRDLTAMMNAIASHPLMQTLLTAAVALGTAR